MFRHRDVLRFDHETREIDAMISEKDIEHYKAMGWSQPAPSSVPRGMRFNESKPRMDLLDADALQGLAEVLTFGANKYSAHNWRKGLSVSETLASMLRHVAAIQRGEDIDLESGKPHIDHVGCNWMFLSNFFKHPELYQQFDDRWKPDAN